MPTTQFAPSSVDNAGGPQTLLYSGNLPSYGSGDTVELLHCYDAGRIVYLNAVLDLDASPGYYIAPRFGDTNPPEGIGRKTPELIGADIVRITAPSEAVIFRLGGTSLFVDFAVNKHNGSTEGNVIDFEIMISKGLGNV